MAASFDGERVLVDELQWQQRDRVQGGGFELHRQRVDGTV